MSEHVYTKYIHHDVEVRVRADLKGKHREHCLCFKCSKFAPRTLENCGIAAAVYSHCVTFNIVTPVWECPDFEQGQPKSEVPPDGQDITTN